VLSDQIKGGFYASQDADYSLDDDGDYFTWSLDELRAALLPDEARVMELYYDVEAHGEMHHNPAKNVLWIARDATDIAKQLGLDETTVRLTVAKSKGKLLAARLPRPTPFIDKTMYVSWNAMFVSAYLDAACVLGGSLSAPCCTFALKTLDRMLKEAWTETRGFGHRIGGPALEGSLDDQVFSVLALLDAYEATLNPRYFAAAQETTDLAMHRHGDAEGGGFFDRPCDAAPMGGLDVRRKPSQALDDPPHVVVRHGQSVVRVTPATPQLLLAGTLIETLPHLRADKPLAVVCSGQTCLPPTNDPQHLSSLLTDCRRSAQAS